MVDSASASFEQDKNALVKEIKPRKRALLPLGKIFSLFSALLVFIGVYKSINLLSLMGYWTESFSFCFTCANPCILKVSIHEKVRILRNDFKMNIVEN